MSEPLTTSETGKPPSALREQFYPLSERTVLQIPEQERPRELFDRLGAEQMSDKHLIAILLRSGIKGRNVVDMAEGLLREYGSLSALAEVSTSDLSRIKGMGRVRAQVLRASFELSRRLSASQKQATAVVRTPPEAVAALRSHVSAEQREFETFWVLLLDTKYRLRRPPVEITRGILDASLVHPREVFKEAVRSNSAALILMHNHPSGDPTPSAEDVRITRQLVEAGRVVGIDVLDHVIIGRGQAGGRDHVSLRESGLVSFGG